MGINDTTIGQGDNSASLNIVGGAGAVYVFTQSNEIWTQQAYIKASNTGRGDSFGVSITLSSDGNSLAVGANREDNASTGVNNSDTDQEFNITRTAGALVACIANRSVFLEVSIIIFIGRKQKSD